MNKERIGGGVSARTYACLGALAALCVVGILLVLATTEYSVGIDSDAVGYVGAARNVAAGRGVFLGPPNDLRAYVHWPPLFPVMLAQFWHVGLDAADAARWLNALLFGATILLVGGALLAYSPNGFGLPVVGAAMMLVTQSVLSTHAVARSEPLFIFLGTLGLILLTAHLGKPSAVLLACAIVCIAGAFMTRYIGGTLVAAGALALLLWRGGPLLVRIRDAAILSFCSCAPMILWMIRNAHYAGTTTNRKLSFHPVSGTEVRRGLFTITDWLFPGISQEQPWGFALAAATALVLVILILALRKTGLRFLRRDSASGDTRLRRLSHVMAAYVVIYVLFLLVAISFFDSSTPLSDRLLLPAYVAALIAVVCVAHQRAARAQGSKGRAAIVVLAAIGVVILLADARKTALWIAHARENGIEAIDTLGRRPDGIIARLKAIPGSPIVYTNGGAAVQFLLGTYNTRQLPKPRDAGTGEVNPHYGRDVAAMKAEMVKGGTYAALIDQYRFRDYFISEEEMKAEMPLRVFDSLPDGIIYEFDRAAAEKAAGGK